VSHLGFITAMFLLPDRFELSSRKPKMFDEHHPLKFHSSSEDKVAGDIGKMLS
jgi:hypothetical protein